MLKEKTRPEEKQDIQLDIKEKPQLKRRVMIYVAIVVALLMAMAITVYLINQSTPPRDCPWTRQQCRTQPHITKFYIPNVPLCFDC
jgi:flagellar basal body-associated protein FliL